MNHFIVDDDARDDVRTLTCSCGYWVASGSSYVHIWFEDHRKRSEADEATILRLENELQLRSTSCGGG